MICLIGNSGTSHNLKDGQTSKVRLYLRKIQEEGYDVNFIDLERFNRHPFSTLLKIKKGLKKCDRIVLISAKRGCKVLIPYINSLNKKYNKPFVLPLIGTSVLHYSLDNLSIDEQNNFLLNRNYSLCKKPSNIAKQLSKITTILSETDLLTNTFKGFYNLSNCYTLTNFRDYNSSSSNNHINKVLRLVFISRVASIKGIFDILETIKDINSNEVLVTLDIYGPLYLDKEELIIFNQSLSGTINYKGTIDMEETIGVISGYDLLVFPTRYLGEGTPGVIVESLLANTPILTSSFPQASSILTDGYDSVFYKIFDKNDLKEKLLYLLNNREKLIELSNGIKQSSQNYTYYHERNKFLRYICGKDVK